MDHFGPSKSELKFRMWFSLAGLVMLVGALVFRGLPMGPAMFEVVAIAGALIVLTITSPMSGSYLLVGARNCATKVCDCLARGTSHTSERSRFPVNSGRGSSGGRPHFDLDHEFGTCET